MKEGVLKGYVGDWSRNTIHGKSTVDILSAMDWSEFEGFVFGKMKCGSVFSDVKIIRSFRSIKENSIQAARLIYEMSGGINGALTCLYAASVCEVNSSCSSTMKIMDLIKKNKYNWGDLGRGQVDEGVVLLMIEKYKIEIPLTLNTDELCASIFIANEIKDECAIKYIYASSMIPVGLVEATSSNDNVFDYDIDFHELRKGRVL